MNQPPVRILFVDDSEVTLHILALMVRNEGYEIYECHEPEKALGMVRDLDIDIVVTDWSMPGMDGLELLRLIARLRPEVVRIMLTAHATLHLAVDAMNQGHVRHFLTKPMRAAEVRNALKEAATDVQVRRRERVGDAQRSLHLGYGPLTDVLIA